VRTKLISVIGGSQCSPSEAEAAETGRRLAQSGFGVICGGRGGVTEAACRGAWQAGGLTVGLLPGESAGQGNDFLTVELATGLGEARNVLVVRGGEAVIAIGGGLGTLAEIAHALRLGIRVVALGTWQATSPEGGTLPVLQASTPAEAVALAIEGDA
jgi:uncharacterized protein (TIGR00725 family)